MDWYDVDDIIYEGTKEQVQALRCPECNHSIEIDYSEESHSMTVRCLGCGYIARSTGCPKPKYLEAVNG